MGNNDRLNYIIDEMIESDYVDFKAQFYDRNNKAELIKDVVAFANSFSNEPSRYIIFGIKEGQGSTQKQFFDQNLPDDPATIQQLIQNNIEPDITFSLYNYTYQKYKLLILEITGYNDKPYIIKKDYNNRIKKGDIYIRTNSTIKRAERRDLDMIYRSKVNYFNPQDIELSFSSNKQNREKIYINNHHNQHLNDDLPSNIRKRNLTEQLNELIQHKESLSEFKDKPVREFPKFDSIRFSNNKIRVGSDKFNLPIYKSEEELKESIEEVHSIYYEEDEYYLFSEIAEKINFCITNKGTEFLRDVEIKISFSQNIGYVFEEYVSKPNQNFGINLPILYSDSYPYIEKKGDSYIITETFDRLRHKSSDDIFTEPLRVFFNSFKKGEIVFTYEVNAENLPQPIEGKLIMELEVK